MASMTTTAWWPTIPADMFPGEAPVVLNGPFTVCWNGTAVALGHTLHVADSPGGTEVLWNDGNRWHGLPSDFSTRAQVNPEGITWVDDDGRVVLIRAVRVEDRDLIAPHVETVAGLVALLAKAWAPGIRWVR